MWKIRIRRLVVQKLTEVTQTAAENVSMREFAHQLGISSGAFSELISGKRKLTIKTAKKILRLLDLTDDERDHLIAELDGNINQRRTLVPEEAHDLISNWTYFATLSLLEIDNPPRTAFEIAKLLGIHEEKAHTALKLLHGYGFIKKIDEKTFETLGKALTTTDNETSSTIAERHRSNLTVALAALSKLGVKERDFTSNTFSGNSKLLGAAKKDIRKILDSIADDMAEGPIDQVFQISVQLFPLLGWEKDERKREHE